MDNYEVLLFEEGVAETEVDLALEEDENEEDEDDAEDDEDDEEEEEEPSEEAEGSY